MTFLAFATWIVVAVGTAWGAAAVMKYGGHGLTADVLLGLIGSGSACGIVWGIDMFPELGMAATALVAFAGAGAAIALQRKFFYAPTGNADAHRGRR